MIYTPEPCVPSQSITGIYGVGTKFRSTNMLGAPEVLVTEQCTYNPGVGAIVVFSCGGITIKHEIKLQNAWEGYPEGACLYSMSMEGPKMGLFTSHIQKQMAKLRDFIQADIANIMAASGDAQQQSVGNGASHQPGPANGPPAYHAPASAPPPAYQASSGPPAYQPEIGPPKYGSPTHQQPTSAPSTATSIPEQIQQLHSMKERGILDDEEFEKAKEKLLAPS